MAFLVHQKKSVWAIFLALFLFCLLLLPLFNPTSCLATSAEGNALNIFEKTGIESGFTSATNEAPNIYQIIGFIVNIVLSFTGVIFLVLVIAGGFMWMTASGNDEKVKKGRDLVLQSIIGLTIVLVAFLLTNFVVAKLILGIWMD